jgi:hypothetical protein
MSDNAKHKLIIVKTAESFFYLEKFRLICWGMAFLLRTNTVSVAVFSSLSAAVIDYSNIIV